MPAYGITIRGSARDDLLALKNKVATRGFAKVAGAAGVRVLQDHFVAKERDAATHTTATQLGARPQGLFAQFRRGTHREGTGTTVTLVVSHPAILQRINGGTIRPVNTRNLTIPANSYAYGRRAREVGAKLVFAFAPRPDGKWMPALVAYDAITKEVGAAKKDGTRRKKVVRPSGVYYWLVRQVTQRGDPSTVPTQEQITTGITEAIAGWVDEVIAQKNAEE